MSSRRSPSARDVLGVPFLPPGSATVAVNRVRARLGRAHRSMAPPPVQILEASLSMLEHRVIVALCDAGVPDVLEGPVELPELARRTGTDPVMLERLIRFGSTRGWVRIDRRGRVRPTRLTRFLRTDHPGGWRAWVEFAAGDEVTAAVGALTATTSADPFATVNDAPFFDWMAEHPDRWDAFDRAMAAGARLHGMALADALDWTTASSVCDVGGGTGALLATLLDLRPHLVGTVIDLPGVVDRLVDHPRLSAVGGDMFEQVPSDLDTYLLVAVLHDWSDDDAVRILGRVRDACHDTSRVVIVEQGRTRRPHADLATSTDVLMAALTSGGRERSIDDLVRLGRTVGLVDHAAHRLPSADTALVFRT